MVNGHGRGRGKGHDLISFWSNYHEMSSNGPTSLFSNVLSISIHLKLSRTGHLLLAVRFSSKNVEYIFFNYKLTWYLERSAKSISKFRLQFLCSPIRLYYIWCILSHHLSLLSFSLRFWCKCRIRKINTNLD